VRLPESSIEQLLQSPEGKTLEFKRDLSSPRNLLKTLVAFANTAGGYLLVGVDDERQVVGVAQPLDEEERLANLISDSIAPRLVPDIELLNHAGKDLLRVQVFPSGLRPHYLKAEGIDGGAYVRLGSSSRQAGPELVAELQRSAAGVVFDELPMPALTINDLDLDTARRWFGDQRALDEKALLTLRLLVREQGRLVPTKGAVLLFGKQRELHFPDAWVQCGRFAGTDKTHIIDHRDIHAALPDCVEQVLDFLKKHAMRGADFSEVRRKDVWSIPLLMLREAVINALVHADYSQVGVPIRVAFFDDRIEVESPGILVPGLTVEDMKLGVSSLRNRVIGRVFRELNLIEQWGSGVRRIFSEAQALGLPEPAIVEVGMRLRLTVYIAAQAGVESEVGLGVESGAESGVESRAESSIAEQVLQSLQAAPRSKSAIAHALGKAKPNRYLNELMNRLLESGQVAYTVPEKPQSRLQRYRLTAKGRRGLLPAASPEGSADE
jgi:ATP-dependent DNA helicase RecG